MQVSTSGILSRMFAMMKSRFGPLLGLWLVYMVVQIGYSIVFMMVIGLSAFAGGALDDPAAMLGLGAGMIGLMILFYLGYLLIYVASYASLTNMSSPLIRPTFGEAISAGFRSALPLFAVMLLLLLIYFVGALVLGLLGTALTALGDTAGAIFVILLLPVMIYLGCRLSIVFPLVAVDGIRNPVTAVTRSWTLTRGNVLSIFGALVVYLVITLLLLALVFVPVFGMGGSFDNPAAGVGAAVLLLVGLLVVGIVVTIMGSALAAAIHGGVSEASGGTLSETFE